MNKCVLVFFLFSFLLYSCQDDSDPFLIYNIDQDFRIDFREHLTPTSQELVLNIESLASFSCEEAVVASEFAREENNLNLTIQEIKLPTNCETGEGEHTAKKSLNIGEIPPGEYDFTISIQDAIFNYGKLVVTHLAYELIFDTELNGIELPHSKFLRIPKGTVWGRFKHNNPNANFLSEYINESMLEAGAVIKTLPEGRYSNFEVDANGMWKWDTPNTYNAEYSIVYDYPSTNYTALETLANQIRTEYGNDFDFEMYTYTGEQF